MAVRLPSTIESAATTAITGVQPDNIAVPDRAAFRAGKTERQDFGQNVKAGDLGTGGDERRARRGRAFIGVRRPQMERHRRHLETKADHRHHDGHQQQRIQSLARQTGGDFAADWSSRKVRKAG